VPISRRGFVSASALAAPVMMGLRPFPSNQNQTTSAENSPGPTFPTQAPELAREMVGASHGNIARVKELLARHQTLARASWDWGFGDWEDALGAASHVGNREIAELLIANGARPTLFSAAMLGQLDVVRAFITASPGVEVTPGAHGITLMRHAAAGGAQALPVVEYLKTVPGADAPPASQPILPEALAALAGTYVFGAAADERVVIAQTRVALTFLRVGGSARNLVHRGDREFFPVGAPKVRIQFRDSPGALTVTVHDPDLVIEARRVS